MSMLTFSYWSPFSARTIRALRARGDIGKSYNLIMWHLLVLKSSLLNKGAAIHQPPLRNHTTPDEPGQPAFVLTLGQGLKFSPVKPHTLARRAFFDGHLVVLERNQLLATLGTAHEGLLTQRRLFCPALLLFEFCEQLAVALSKIAVLFSLLLLSQFLAKAVFLIHDQSPFCRLWVSAAQEFRATCVLHRHAPSLPNESHG